MGLSPKEMHDRIIDNLADKTGHAFAHWRRIVDTERGEKSDKDMVAHLKAHHDLGHYTAVAIVKQAGTGNEYNAEDDLVAELFAGKAAAKRLYEALDADVMALAGTERVPCKTYVGYRAKTQFLIIAPVGDAGVRCGLALPPETAGLEPASNLGSTRIMSRFDLGPEGPTPAHRQVIRTAYQNNS